MIPRISIHASIHRSNISLWRTSPKLHLPNLEWGSHSNGWGMAGELIFKVYATDNVCSHVHRYMP